MNNKQKEVKFIKNVQKIPSFKFMAQEESEL